MLYRSMTDNSRSAIDDSVIVSEWRHNLERNLQANVIKHFTAASYAFS